MRPLCTGPPIVGGFPVPEPTSLFLLAIGGLAAVQAIAGPGWYCAGRWPSAQRSRTAADQGMLPFRETQISLGIR